ncbi:MAG TPA: NYN domain-containing protein [Actinobacteria bacterium]|nr:NYN domain-containing protein [Actinomycetota bacterium]
MKEFIIIDGYNIINRESRYNQHKDDLETARVKLIEDLVNYGALVGCDITVVFDGSANIGGSERKTNIHGVEVYFTKRGQTADSLIEKLAYEVKKFKKVVVVTADYDQQKAVFSEGVLRKTPGEMANEIIETKNQSLVPKKVKSKRMFLEDRLSEKVRESLRRLI